MGDELAYLRAEEIKLRGALLDLAITAGVCEFLLREDHPTEAGNLRRYTDTALAILREGAQ